MLGLRKNTPDLLELVKKSDFPGSNDLGDPVQTDEQDWSQIWRFQCPTRWQDKQIPRLNSANSAAGTTAISSDIEILASFGTAGLANTFFECRRIPAAADIGWDLGYVELLSSSKKRFLDRRIPVPPRGSPQAVLNAMDASPHPTEEDVGDLINVISENEQYTRFENPFDE